MSLCRRSLPRFVRMLLTRFTSQREAIALVAPAGRASPTSLGGGECGEYMYILATVRYRRPSYIFIRRLVPLPFVNIKILTSEA